MAFSFNPTEGLLNTTSFPTTPNNETEARQQFMTLLNQLKDGINAIPIIDLTEITNTLSTHLADYVRQPAFAATTGSANTYAITTNPAPTSYVDGMSAYLDINVVNTGASTLNWNGLGAKPIVTSKGAALTAGKLPANSIIGVRYNASAGNFQLLGEGGEYGTAGAAQVLTGYTVGTDDGVIDGTLIQNPEVTFAASDIIRTEYNNPSGAVYSTTYTKRNEFKVNGKGTIRVKMGLYRDATSGYVYGKVYINGVAVGTERSTSSTTVVYFTEDFTVNKNDLISIWTKGSNTNLMQYVYTAIEYDFANVPDAPTRTL